MADILIRGIKIPKSCVRCHFTCERCGQYYCIFQTEEQNEAALTLPDLYKNCPLHLGSLPAGHGRLIDADALKKYWQTCEEKLGQKNTLGLLTYHDVLSEAVIYDLDKAPTIIPAEGGIKL